MNENDIEDIVGTPFEVASSHRVHPHDKNQRDSVGVQVSFRDGYLAARKHEVSLLAQMARIRYAIGDKGTRDITSLVKYLAALRRDAELFNSLQEIIYDLRDLHEKASKPFYYSVLIAYLAKHKPECVPDSSVERTLSEKQTPEAILAHHINKRKNATPSSK